MIFSRPRFFMHQATHSNTLRILLGSKRINPQPPRTEADNVEASQPGSLDESRNLTRPLTVILNLALAVLCFSAGALIGRAQYKGPAFPPPGFQAATFSATGNAGRTGGRTFTYPSFDLRPVKSMYWGAQLGQVRVDMKGDGFQANETMVYVPTASNLAQGFAVFRGTSAYCSAFSGNITVNTEMQLQVLALNNAPLPLSTSPSINGAEAPVLLVPSTGFKANFILLANGSPYLNFRDSNNSCTPSLPSVGSVAFGFWFTLFPNADFDRDGKTDVSVWNPTNHNWYIQQSSTDTLRTQIDWGSGSLGDIPVPGDYDGDGKTDIAVWRPAEGNWYIIQSSDNTILLRNWGLGTDIPVPGDYDGDGKTDLAIWRPAEGSWYIIRSSGGGIARGWGMNGDRPLTGDFDGDGKTDLAVFRPTDGNWYIIRSSTNTGTVTGWGLSSDSLVPADYDGDGKTDIAVWRPAEGNWYIIRSSGGGIARNWGNNGDVPVPGDYDGDGKSDIAVFRPTEGNWYIIRSSDAAGSMQYLGGSGDVPVPSAYLPR